MHGLNANIHSIWGDRRLSASCAVDLLSTIRYDWVHSYLQDGVLSVETWLFLQRCEHLGTTHQALHDFLADPAWRWPAISERKAKMSFRIFDSYRNASSETADKLKCGASELLGVYGMIRHFVETRIGFHADIAAERASFDAACHVLDVLILCKRGAAAVEDGAQALQRAISHHQYLHVQAYGDAHTKPKHHWMHHIPMQFKEDKVIIDAFIVERGHLLVKSVAEHVTNTRDYEASVMAGVLNQQYKLAAESSMGSGLRGPQERLGHFLVAVHMKIDGLHVSHGKFKAYQIWFRTSTFSTKATLIIKATL